MGRGGRGSKKKMWNRKKNDNNRNNKGNNNDQRGQKNGDGRNEWNLVTQLQNHNFETYYVYQGLHSNKKTICDDNDDSKTTFAPCANDEEREKERLRFLASMKTRLPASFRIGGHMDEELTQKIIEDVERFVGTEMELLMDSDGNLINKRVMNSSPKPSDEKDDKKANDGDGQGKDIDTTVTPAKTDTAATEVVDDENKADDTANTDVVTNTTPIETFVKKMAPAKSIPYVPNAYQLSIDRRTIKRNPALTEFHEWLKVQQEAGFITRQETVSMIPPVVLDVKPDHAVLDMCAAPGSKTSQILEIIASIPKDQTEPTGYVIANDSDSKRAYMLVHQLRRLNTPAYFITACDGQFFPMMKGSKDHVMTDEEKAQEGVFDRVLCDVPCTGDGTARKNPGIWKRWLATNGHGLHPLQVLIALNGARLTKVGGYLCYSTCSLNPIENEAVVAELLRASDGSLELVDKRSEMPGFIARPGWSKWKVVTESETRKQKRKRYKKNNEKMCKKREEWKQNEKNAEAQESNQDEKVLEESQLEESIQDEKVTKESQPEHEAEKAPEPVWESTPPSWDEETLRKRLEERGMIVFDKVEDIGNYKHVKRSMFPPSEEEIQQFHLERCMRCLPQDMDTGGFFVALLKKVKPLGERARRKAVELENSSQNQQEDDSGEVLKKKKLNNGETKVVATSECKSKETDTPAETSNASGMNEDKSSVKSNKKERNYEKASQEDFVEVDESILKDLDKFYGLSDSFLKNQLMARGSSNSKLLYFISSSVKKNVFDRGVQNRVKAIHSGLRAFERRSRKDNNKGYRPCQEAIHFIIPHMSKRKFIISADDFSKCIGEGAISIEIFSEGLREEMRELSEGAFAVALQGYENNPSKKFFFTMWKCRGDNVNCLVARAELDGFRSKLDAIVKSNEDAS